MASSSVSQESLDTEDFEIAARKSRIRNLRARGALPRSTEREREEDNWPCQNEDDGDNTTSWTTGAIPEHESPSRSTPASRAKDKRSRPNHLHKGKLPKDKRKLREKRRSTGVVSGLAHLQSTESTGDSLDEDDDDQKASLETKRNTSYNEVIDADNPQTPSDDRIPKGFVSRRNKSPSDLEADLEDNQDYDSTVSQSETNLTLIGKSDSTESNHQSSPKLTGPSKGSYLSSTRYSPSQDTKSFKPYSPTTSDHDSKTPSSTSSSSSVLSRFRYGGTGGESRWRETETANHDNKDYRPVSSILARYQRNDSDNNSTGYYGHSYRDRYRDHVSPGNLHNRSNLLPPQRDDEKIKLEQLLEKEREENKKLKNMLDEKDKKIAELEREVYHLNKDLEDFDSDNQKLMLDNAALIRAVSQLSTRV